MKILVLFLLFFYFIFNNTIPFYVTSLFILFYFILFIKYILFKSKFTNETILNNCVIKYKLF